MLEQRASHHLTSAEASAKLCALGAHTGAVLLGVPVVVPPGSPQAPPGKAAEGPSPHPGGDRSIPSPSLGVLYKSGGMGNSGGETLGAFIYPELKKDSIK